MTLLRRIFLLVLCAAVAGCFPVDQKIVITEDKNKPGDFVAVLTFTYSLNDIQVSRARELGFPVTKELAAEFVATRGYRLTQKGFRMVPGEGEATGFTKFIINCEALDRAARSPANQLVFQRQGRNSSEYSFQYDASIRAIAGGGAVPFALSPQELDQIGHASASLKVQFPGKVLQHSGESDASSANYTTVTWRFKVRDLFGDEPVNCTATVKVLSQTTAGNIPWFILLAAVLGMIVALIQTILQVRTAGDRSARRGQATRKHGHSIR